MKKNKLLVFSIILFILVVIIDWYADFIFSFLWLGYILFVILPLAILFIVWLVLIIIELAKKHKKDMVFLPFALFIISLLIIIIIPTRVVKSNIEVYLLENARLEIIEDIQSNKLIADSNGNVNLTGMQQLLSVGDVTVYKMDENNIIVAFWVYRVPTGRPIQVIYTEKGKRSIIDTIGSSDISKIKKLKNNWYYVIWSG